MRAVKRFIILFMLLTAPAWIYANDKHRKVSDHDLATQIQQRLVTVAPNSVVVVVDEATRTAYLQGKVSSQEEIDRITEALRTFDGVRVIGSNLVVNTATAASLYAEDQDNETDDSTAMLNEQETTENEMLNEAEEQNNYNNDSEDPIAQTLVPTDASVNEAIIHALKSEGIMGQSKIRVETESGVVTLTGTALSEAQADRIVQLARSVPGVLGINSNIQIRDEKRPYKVKPSPEVDKEGRQIDPDDDDF